MEQIPLHKNADYIFTLLKVSQLCVVCVNKSLDLNDVLSEVFQRVYIFKIVFHFPK